MSRLIPYPVLALLFTLGQPLAAADAGGESAASRANDVIEEVIVTAPEVARDKVQSLETIYEIYQARQTGAILYKQQKYREALPHLLQAAKRGFKFAQARVGFIYQQGLDEVPQDPEAAVGWLGVAAQGRTHPEILNYFNNLWARIPESYRPGFEEIIDYYVATYGNRANRVGCDLSHRAGTYMRELTCRFEDENLYDTFTMNDTIEGVEMISGGIFSSSTGDAESN